MSPVETRTRTSRALGAATSSALLLPALLVSGCSARADPEDATGTATSPSPADHAQEATEHAPEALSPGPTGDATVPCVGAPVPERWQHLVWIWFENKPDVAVIGSPEAPYLNRLATSCALATDYHALTHPSLPNYIAATSGTPHDIVDDAGPRAHPLDGPSIFTQVDDAGLEWRSYLESMPATCALDSTSSYAVKHNPAAYYTEIRDRCSVWDVPGDMLAIDAGNDALPAFALVVPDLCHDMHDCSVGTGDAWLSAVLPGVLESPGYRDGTTAIFITWDEDDSAHDNRVPLIVVAPAVRPGTGLSARLDHYGLLRTTEQMLGLSLLGGAATAAPVPAPGR